MADSAPYNPRATALEHRQSMNESEPHKPCAADDNSLTSSNTVAKLSATSPSSHSCVAAKRCSISVSVSFFRSWVGLAGADEETPLPWPRPAEARPVVERPPPLAGTRFERVAEAPRLAPPRKGASAAELGRVVRLPDMPHFCSRCRTSRAASATRSNRAPASGGGRSATGRASVGHGQGSGMSSSAPASPTQEREDETKTEIEQRFGAAQE